MAGKRLKLDNIKKKVARLSDRQMKKVKGGYRNVPSGSGAVGLINWGGVDIRENEGGNDENLIPRGSTFFRLRRLP